MASQQLTKTEIRADQSPTKSPRTRTEKFFNHAQWQQCAVHFLQSVRAKSERTYIAYRSNLRAFFADPRRTPDTYTRGDVEDFISALTHGTSKSGTQPASGTRNNRLAAIRSFYTFAINYDVPFRNSTRPLMHKSDPTKHIDTLRTGGARKTLTDDEVKRFFAAIPADTLQGRRDRALFLSFFGQAGGLRRSPISSGRICSQPYSLRMGE